MERIKKLKREREEAYLELQIAATKARLCIQRYEQSASLKWLDFAKAHLETYNTFLLEFEKLSEFIPDPADYLDLEHPDRSSPAVIERRTADFARSA